MKTSKQGLAYESTGPEKSDLGLVFVHGWGCRHSDWDPVVQHLTTHPIPNLQLIRPDLPGHGSTPLSIQPQPTTAGFSALILDLCLELNLKKIYLAGHSMGVRVVSETWRQIYTSSNKDIQVQGIIFIDGSHYKLRPSLFAFDKGDPRSANLSEEEKAKLKAKAFNDMFSPLTPRSFKESALEHVAQRDKAYSEAVRDGMITYDREEMEKTIGLLGKEGGTPLLNVQSSDVGAGNQRIAMKEGEKSRWMVFLEEQVPQVRQVVVTESAHFPQVDKPQVVAEAIRKFIEDVRGDQ